MIQSAIPAIEGELWRDVPGYVGLYRVSNRGRILSLPRKAANGARVGGLLKPARRGPQGHERFYVTLCKGTRETNWSTTVHQLVMLAFVGPPLPGQEVRHLDGNQANNRWEPGNEAETKAAGGNLFYGTHKENGEDMVRHGSARASAQRGREHYQARLTEDLAGQIRREYASGGITERDLAARYGVHCTTIHALLIRRTWQHVA